ncbi:MAG: MBL fold metallo-hydrolase, partial [Exilibacterium sp.]
VPPALTVRSLPFIDYVVISHNHYDHLDLHTLRQIAELSRSDGRQTLFLVPEGLQGWLKENGIIHTVELIWWKTYTKDNWRFTAVPVQHHSGRGVFDHNRSKWAGWAIEKNDFRFFFMGDSGYFSGFKEIGERLGPFTLAAIPIGGYAPRKLMQYAHMNPEEAIAVHKDIRAKKSVGIHWGTFLGLTDEPFFEPRHRLSTEVARAGLEKTEFSAIDIGQSITLTDR